MSAEDLERRIYKLEKMLDNGRFLRKDIFEIVLHDVRDDYTRITSELAEIRAAMKAEQAARSDDRKAIRNIIIAAFLAALGSLGVSLLVAASVG